MPRREWWTNLKSKFDTATEQRVWLSYELICEADIGGVRRVFEEVGPDLHAVLVLRSFGTFLPSMWQQKVKMGSSASFDEFLQQSLADPRAVKITGSDAFHRNDGKNLIERWCEVIGPERLTVLVLDGRHPTRLFDAFESMLGLPSGFLASAPSDGYQNNRSMSAVEVELVRRLNATILRDWGTPKPAHRELVWMGAVDRMLAFRTPGEEEGRITLPEWAAAACTEAGEYLARAIRKSGVRVIGDVRELERPVPTAPSDSMRLPLNVPTDAAVEALLGMFAKSTGRPTSYSGGPVPEAGAGGHATDSRTLPEVESKLASTEPSDPE
jgi:hypothetical protein